MSKYEITINDKTFVVEVGDVSTSPVQIIVDGEQKTVVFKEADTPSITPVPVASAPSEPAPEPEPAAIVEPVSAAEGQVVPAPMPGKILSITVKLGDSVSEGDTICTLEAMKMEMPISSTSSGIVQGIHVQVGETVGHDAPMVTVG